MLIRNPSVLTVIIVHIIFYAYLLITSLTLNMDGFRGGAPGPPQYFYW